MTALGQNSTCLAVGLTKWLRLRLFYRGPLNGRVSVFWWWWWQLPPSRLAIATLQTECLLLTTDQSNPPLKHLELSPQANISRAKASELSRFQCLTLSLLN